MKSIAPLWIQLPEHVSMLQQRRGWLAIVRPPNLRVGWPSWDTMAGSTE